MLKFQNPQKRVMNSYLDKISNLCKIFEIVNKIILKNIPWGFYKTEQTDSPSKQGILGC